MYLLFLAIALIAGLLLGGSLRRLLAVDIVGLPWIIGALLLPLVLRLADPHAALSIQAVVRSIVLISYGALFVGLSRNWKMPGIPLVGAGSFLNYLAISRNGYRMPVRVDALPIAFQESEAQRLVDSLTHTAVGPNTKWTALADNFPLRLLSERPALYSIGDVLLAAGLAWLVFRSMRPRLFR